MALTERTFIREVHIVKPDPASPWSACQLPITEVLRDGVVISAQYGNAEPLNVSDVGQALDVAFIDLANERDAALASLQSALSAKSDVETALAGANAQIAALTAERDALAAQLSGDTSSE